MPPWYYSFNGEQFGPVALDELRQLAEDGVLSPRDLVWHAGQTEWQPAGTVPELPFAQEPPPLPAQPLLNQVWDNNWENAAGSAPVSSKLEAGLKGAVDAITSGP
mgnify:CR=1 FL=1